MRNIIYFALFLALTSITSSSKVCTETDLTYAYTECSNNMRWRVQVPKFDSDCTASSVAFPTQGLQCNFTCPSGHFLDIEKSTCSECPIGYYSLGSGILFDTFHKVPIELVSTAEQLGTGSNASCEGSGWLPMGSFLAGKPDGRCLLKLLLTVNLVTEGAVTFRYQYRRSEALFMFDVQNDRCESLAGDSGPGPWLEETEQGEIAVRSTTLRMGMNVLRWTLVAPMRLPLDPIMEPSSSGGGKPVGSKSVNQANNFPALLYSIEVTGLPFVYSCQPCHAGTHTASPGQARCTKCPRDQFSPGGGSGCAPCPSDKYAPPGSAECLPKPVCQLYEPWQYPACTKSTDGVTRLQHRWVQPQVCRESDQGVQLPPPGPEEPCSKDPCYPGAELVVATSTTAAQCRACPAGQFSPDSAGHCKPCPASTQPRVELLINNWLLVPLEETDGQQKSPSTSNKNDALLGTTADFISVSCQASNADTGCPGGGNGWLSTRTFLRTSSARGLSSRVLQIRLSRGFLTPTSDLFGRQGPAFAGRLRLEFATECRMPCQLALYENSPQRGSSLRRRWTDTQAKQNFTYDIKSPGPVTFQLVFETVVSVDPLVRENATGDHLKVFAVHVTNVNGSGAVGCTRCPMGLKDAKCIPCMPGHYYFEASANQTISGQSSLGTCLPCPSGTRIVRHPAIGLSSCSVCPAGLKAVSGTACQLDSRPLNPLGQAYNLDWLLALRLLASSGKMFALSGAQYSHLYNLSLTGAAVCESNATKEFLRAAKGTEFSESMVTRIADTFLCRSTLVPNLSGSPGGGGGGGGRSTLLLPIGLADQLLNASFTERRVSDARLRSDGFTDDVIGAELSHQGYDLDVWLGTAGSEQENGGTPDGPIACPEGRLARVTLRCDPGAGDSEDGSLNGDAVRLMVPPACPDGTCDGCQFRLLLLSRHACPICRSKDFDKVRGECLLGKQTLHLFPPKLCFEADGSKPRKRTETVGCPIVSGPILVLLLALIGVGLLSCLLAVYCYRKNKSLQYKYTQLIEANEGDPGSGSVVESCAVDEDDEDDDEDGDDKKGRNGGAGSSSGSGKNRAGHGAMFARVSGGSSGRTRGASGKATLMENLGDVDL